MEANNLESTLYSRRDFGKVALAAVPAAGLLINPALARARAQTRINSKINGVQLGAITYSFNRLAANPDDIVNAYVTIGLGEMELMSNHAEALAGAPSGRAGGPPPTGGGQGRGRGTPLTPEQQAAQAAAREALRKWRLSATEATFKPVRQKIENAGIELRLLCYNMNVNNTPDDEIEYAFLMARALGAKAISTSTQVSMAKRLAPFAEKHRLPVGFHGHANLTNPDEVATPESFLAVMAASKYLGANLDIGHYTAAGYDPVAFIKEHHARMTNLHVKDRKKPEPGVANPPTTPFGQGDTPIKEVLQLLKREQWDIPANIEFEYGGDPLVEVPKCLQYCKDALG